MLFFCTQCIFLHHLYLVVITNIIQSTLTIIYDVDDDDDDDIMQVKVLLKWRLKLVEMISLSIHMMTRQDRVCVQCVTNGLQRKDTWMFTNEFTVERSHLCVQCVTNGLQQKDTWMFTNEFTVERSHLCVPVSYTHLTLPTILRV